MKVGVDTWRARSVNLGAEPLVEGREGFPPEAESLVAWGVPWKWQNFPILSILQTCYGHAPCPND